MGSAQPITHQCAACIIPHSNAYITTPISFGQTKGTGLTKTHPPYATTTIQGNCI